MTAPAAKLLPFFTVCPTCEARRYDEGNRRHVTVQVGDPQAGFGARYVCLDVVVPEPTDGFAAFPGDVDRVLDAVSAKLTGRPTSITNVHFVRAS